MILKIGFLFIALIESSRCGLLRTPKVYNALITTDQNLTPSRAYPVIQPTVHEAPFLYPPYAYNGFGPFGIVDPFIGGVPDVFARFNSATQKTDAAVQTGKMDGSGGSSSRNFEQGAQANAIHSNGFVRQDDNSLVNPSMEKSPVPLNEFGFPPSLVPLSSFNRNPVNLAPLNFNNFNSYPLLFDQFGGFQQGPYLPPFGYYPDPSFAAFGGHRDTDKQQNPRPNAGFDGQQNPPFARPNVGFDGQQNPPFARPNVGFDGQQNPPFARPNVGLDGQKNPSPPRPNVGFDGQQNPSHPRPNGAEDGAGTADGSDPGTFGNGNGATGGTSGAQDDASTGNSGAASTNNGVEAAAGSSSGNSGDGDGGSGSGGTAGSAASGSNAGSGSSSGSSSGAGGGQSSSSSSQSAQSESASSQSKQQSQSNVRRGRLFYINGNIKNNKNRDANIADVPPPPIPFRIKTGNGKN